MRKAQRPVYFGALEGYVSSDIFDGDRLQHGMRVPGPAVVEQENTTIVVSPGHQLKVNRYGDFVLQCSSKSTVR